MALLMRAVLVLCFLLALAASAVAQPTTNYTVLYQSFPLCDIATDGSGAVYVLLCDGDVVKLAPNGTQLLSFEAQYKAAINSSAAIVRPLRPYQLRVSASGTVWVLDYLNAQLVGVANVASSTPTVFVIPLLPFSDLTDFSIASNSENLWLVTPGADYVLQQVSPQGAVLLQWNATNVPALSDYFLFGVYATPTSVYVGGCYPLVAFYFYDYVEGQYNYPESGPLYPYHVEGCDVRQFSPSGTLLRTFNASYPVSQYYQFAGLVDLAVDGSGNLYAIDAFFGDLFQWASNGTQLQVTPAEFSDLASSPSGAVYASTYADRFAVVTINPANLTTALTSVEISSNTFANDQSVALSPDGRIVYATSYSGNRILQLNASTGAVIGNLGVGLLVQSQWLATDPAGNIYVSDSGAAVVYKLSSNGSLLLTITGSSPNTSFMQPQGVAVNPTTGELVVADYSAALLLVFSSAGVFERSIDTSQYLTGLDSPVEDPSYYFYYSSNPYSVAVTPTGTIVYVDQGLRDVVIIPASGNATSLVGNAVVTPGVFGSQLRTHSPALCPLPLCLTLAHRVTVCVCAVPAVQGARQCGRLQRRAHLRQQRVPHRRIRLQHDRTDPRHSPVPQPAPRGGRHGLLRSAQPPVRRGQRERSDRLLLRCSAPHR